jgi:predicted O-methyltransferase YrrM
MRAEEFTIGFDSVKRLAEGAAPASLAQRERIMLYSLVYGLAPRYAIELGSYKGGSAYIISGALDDLKLDGRLLCIEPHLDQVLPEMREATAHNTRFVKGFFPQGVPAELDGNATDNLFEFAFYDADHTEAGIKAHMPHLHRIMAPGAYLLCHDAYNQHQSKGMFAGAQQAGFIDCGSVTRCANDTADPNELYGGLRMFKKPGELPSNSD